MALKVHDHLSMSLVAEVGKKPITEFWGLLKQVPLPEKKTLILYRGATDLRFFIQIFLPHYCPLPFSGMQEDALEEFVFGVRGRKRVRAGPRGCAKSTFKAFFEILHDICYVSERYILIASNTEEQSKAKLKDIRNELLENELLHDVFGKFFFTKVVAATEFICSNQETKIKL